MPIQDTNVIDGPNTQGDGSVRGVIEVIFDDGRKVQRNVRAANMPAWANLLADLPAEVQTKQEMDDAEEGVSSDAEVVANKEASIEQRAVAYLRAAWQTENAYEAFLLFDKFNDFRLAKGWNLNQVQAGLMSAGLEAEEWDAMKTAYQYLAGGGRPATMQTANAIQGNWDDR